jgi:hypothetical protein
MIQKNISFGERDCNNNPVFPSPFLGVVGSFLGGVAYQHTHKCSTEIFPFHLVD